MSTQAKAYEPYIPASAEQRELSVRALIVGTLLGMVFGASSLYLVLRVGLTVSASIPVAVISITLFRLVKRFGGKDATILENNIVQTAGSAGESIAFGVGVTMPAIMILGFDLEIVRVSLVAVLGALLGILMMIPLRRALIVEQHGLLKYPEGTACAEVLKAGADAESQALASAAHKTGPALSGAGTIFGGFVLGLLYKSWMVAFKGWKSEPEKEFHEPLKGGSVGIDISPELLGVGYIIGPRIASIMVGGGVLAYLVLIPMIKFFGDGLDAPLPPGDSLIRDMGPGAVRSKYVLYIGAGAVAAGGIISLLRSLPTIWGGLKHGFSGVGKGKSNGVIARTDRDMPMKVVFLGILSIVAVISMAPMLEMNIFGALLIVVFGFLFVTVSSRLCGEIGSSSNPISGMTVATLLLTCLMFLIMGWTAPHYYVTALSVGAIVCIAASNGGATSQDLKTGFLVGATPRHQQVSILLGALASALILGPILIRLNDAATVYVPIGSAEVEAKNMRVDVSTLTKREKLQGPQAEGDDRTYLVWNRIDANGTAARYLVDERDGTARYLVDPGINGAHVKRPDGSAVTKFDAPKATLMSYIIKGILDRKLPWALVILGAMIALVLELAGVPSLAFAVGVYLPLAASAPIFVGGAVRWIADRRNRVLPHNKGKSEEELTADGDRSGGVLLASGYIAGGAIAGIIIAFLAGAMGDFDKSITVWAEAHNPFYAGAYADMLALIPFVIITGLLLKVAWPKRLSLNKA
ncbi:MAG: oligopeptide transporter, OPT family [Planctomycetes bacterium]|nr:oligopeptide transporter, OPT family [Planctomycetota bacterium]